MPLFLLNLLLMLGLGILNGSFSPTVLSTGFVLGYLVIVLAKPVLGPSSYYYGIWRFLAFTVLFIKEVVMSSIRVAKDVLSPTLTMKPGLIAYPLDVKSDVEIVALSSLICLTPGTLTVDTSEDHSVLYVHGMYAGTDGRDKTIKDIKSALESRVAKLTEVN